MPLKLFVSVKQIPVRCQLTALVNIAEPRRHVDHLRIEIADPLHLVFVVPVFYHGFVGFAHDKGINAFALKLRHHAEHKAGELVAWPRFFYP